MQSKKVEEQIELLKKSGIIFKDEEKAQKIILRENFYYLTTGYDDIFLNLKKTTEELDVYAEETYFEELYAIYKLDRELRNLIFDYINILETNIKSYIAYTFSEKYGECDFFKRKNFREGERYDKSFQNLKKQIDDNIKRDKMCNKKSDLQRIIKEDGCLPLWAMVKVFTFGNMANFYSLMKIEEQQKVAQNLNISPYSLGKYLRMLNIIRNICAHGDILFNIRLNMCLDARDYKYHAKLGISIHNNEYERADNDLFAILIILKRLMSKEDFDKMYIKIENLLSDVKEEIDNQSYKKLLDFMGFPNQYGELDELPA